MEDAARTREDRQQRCSACQDAAIDGQLGSLCVRCAYENHPPIEERGKRWSPLEIGMLSLVCDPLLIPTFLSLKRGLEELREVRLRELIGVWRPEHPRVRTGAMWGMLFGAGRILAFLLIVTTTVISGQLEALESPPPVASVAAYDELGEVLARLEFDDEHQVALAIQHLPDAVSETNALGEQRRALSRVAALEPGPTRDAAILATLRGLPPIGEALERPALAAHTGASIEVQRQIIYELAAGGREAALHRVLRQHADALEPLAPLPHTPIVQAELLSLPVEHPYARLGAERFGATCANSERPVEIPTAQIERAAQWALEQAHAPGPLHAARVRHAARVVPALVCLSTRTARSSLEQATADAEPRIAVAAIATVRDFSPDPDAHEARLMRALRDPLARADWHRQELRVPAAFQAPLAFAEAEGAAVLDREGHQCGEPRFEAQAASEGNPLEIVVTHVWSCAGGARYTTSAPLGPRSMLWSTELESEPSCAEPHTLPQATCGASSEPSADDESYGGPRFPDPLGDGSLEDESAVGPALEELAR